VVTLPCTRSGWWRAKTSSSWALRACMRPAAAGASNRTPPRPRKMPDRNYWCGRAPREAQGSSKSAAPQPMRIESKAPTRVDLAGATLDIWPLYLFHPGAVTINVAITRYASCVIETHSPGDGRIQLVSRDTKREESFASFAPLAKAKRYRLPLLAEIPKFFSPEGGFTLTTDSEAPAGAGIGGSSAMAVAICAALDRFT